MKKNQISKLDFTKSKGLVPAIIQDAETLEVLMLGYMNKPALEKTLKTKKVTFFSRSKNRLWQKGETSGNFLTVVEIFQDCDSDAILIKAKSQGPTCHTGTISCFNTSQFIIQDLFRLIQQRKKDLPKNSYTTKLFKAGQKKILAKIKEESAEIIKAATKETKKRLIEESCDLLYHLFVLLTNEKIQINEIEKELSKRNKK